jgi:hypothetical protein
MLVCPCGQWETGPEGQVETKKLCLLLSEGDRRRSHGR